MPSQAVSENYMLKDRQFRVHTCMCAPMVCFPGDRLAEGREKGVLKMALVCVTSAV